MPARLYSGGEFGPSTVTLVSPNTIGDIQQGVTGLTPLAGCTWEVSTIRVLETITAPFGVSAPTNVIAIVLAGGLPITQVPLSQTSQTEFSGTVTLPTPASFMYGDTFVVETTFTGVAGDSYGVSGGLTVLGTRYP